MCIFASRKLLILFQTCFRSETSTIGVDPGLTFRYSELFSRRGILGKTFKKFENENDVNAAKNTLTLNQWGIGIGLSMWYCWPYLRQCVLLKTLSKARKGVCNILNCSFMDL